MSNNRKLEIVTFEELRDMRRYKGLFIYNNINELLGQITWHRHQFDGLYVDGKVWGQVSRLLRGVKSGKLFVYRRKEMKNNNKMTKEEAIKQLEETQRKLAELKDYIESGNDKSKFWRADYIKPYYCVGVDGSVTTFREDCTSFDHTMQACGNYKPTKEAAEADAKFIKCMHKLRNAARQLNDGWVPDWSDDHAVKYDIFYNHESQNFLVHFNYSRTQAAVYFKTAELALRALDMLDDEDKEVLKGLV